MPVGVGEGYQIAEIARRMLEIKRRMEKHRRALKEDGEHLPAVRMAGQVLGPVTMAVLYLEWGRMRYVAANNRRLRFANYGSHTGRNHMDYAP